MIRPIRLDFVVGAVDLSTWKGNQVTNHRLDYPRAEWLPDSSCCSDWKEISEPKKPCFFAHCLKKKHEHITWYSDTWSSNIQPNRIYRSENREIHTSVFSPRFHYCSNRTFHHPQLGWVLRRPFLLSNWFDIVALLASHLDHSHHSLRVWENVSQHVARTRDSMAMS